MKTDGIAPCLLIVDDEPRVLSALNRVFMDEPFDVCTAANAAEGLDMLECKNINVIISDQQMPGMTGVEFLSKVKYRNPEIIRIILTGHADLNSAIQAINKGEIYKYILKPWNDVELRLIVLSAMEKFNLEEENRRLLKIIRNQAVDMKMLEKKFPGITQINRDSDGLLVIPEVSEEEMNSIIEECLREFPDIDKQSGI
ncbi:MAG: response regulator [Dissulfurispiraceae bacterium]|jgi:DNA-binding NtrC family response regulator|nr:response regulator [Dissulfurispiraceae bacterium]